MASILYQNAQTKMSTGRPIVSKAIKKEEILPITAKREFSRALELATVLHSTLVVDELISLFAENIEQYIHQASVRFVNTDLGIDILLGKKSSNTSNYRLLVAGQNLGEVEFTRGRKFSEKDSIQLEYMITSLLSPLRNALMYQQALKTARTDPLTGVNNRTGFEDCLQREINLANRNTDPLALIVLDVDKFKSINDNYGHVVGDCVLRDIAAAASKCIRGTDMIFRYGGEEFVIILNNTSKDGAHLLAERIRKTIENGNINEYGGNPVSVTVSLGVACLRDKEDSESLFKRADAAMYEAKNSGRNRTVIADE